MAFLRQHPKGMFIDEVQKVPQLLEYNRDSNQNEVDILLKEEGEITAIEVKSSMTYHPSFADSITKQSGWIKTPVVNKMIVYTGDFENTASDVKLINYKHLLL